MRTTHWSVLLLPGEREGAWGYFYENYSGAVEAFFLRGGVPESDVGDLVHEFFLQALKGDFLQKADPERGFFRSYLATAARRFVATYWRGKGRQKRRPEQGVRSLDEGIGVPAGGLTPQEAFDLAWARSVLDRSVGRAQALLQAKGKPQHFEAFVARQEGATWQQVAQACGTTPPAARGWVARCEQLVARFIREEIGGTVPGSKGLETELQELATILGRAP